MADQKVLVIDNPRLLEALSQPEKVAPYLERTMFEAVQIIKDIFAEYPPETEANRPGRINLEGEPLGYYERGRGSWRPIKQGTILGKGSVALGVISAKYAHERHKVKSEPVVIGYKLRPSSQQLGKKWVTQVRTEGSEILGVIGSPVTYADYVNGFQQAKFHERRDWPNPEKAFEQGWPDIEASLDHQLDLYFEEL